MFECECGCARVGECLPACEFVSVEGGVHICNPSPWKVTDRRIQDSLASQSSRIGMLQVK